MFVALQGLKHLIPHPRLLPAIEAARHGPPRTVVLGEVAPRGSSAGYPQDAVNDTAMIAVGTAPFRLPRGQARFQTFPLLVCQICSHHARSVPTSWFCKQTLAVPKLESQGVCPRTRSSSRATLGQGRRHATAWWRVSDPARPAS